MELEEVRPEQGELGAAPAFREVFEFLDEESDMDVVFERFVGLGDLGDGFALLSEGSASYGQKADRGRDAAGIDDGDLASVFGVLRGEDRVLARGA